MLFETPDDNFISLDHLNKRLNHKELSGGSRTFDDQQRLPSDQHSFTDAGQSDAETVLLKTSNAINLFEMDIDELKQQRKMIEKEDKKQERLRKQTEKKKK